MVEEFGFWLMEVALVNSYILYRYSTVSPPTHREYQLSIICSLASEFMYLTPPRGPGRRWANHRQARTGDPDRLNQRPHFLDRDTTGQRDCVVCSRQSRGNRHRTMFFYKTCCSHPPLCPTPCFERYHTLENYRV